MTTMGSSRLWGKITVLIAVCGCCLSAQGKYAGGSGTEAEPFRIAAVSDWQELMATPADWASHFVLTADIDLNDVPITPVGNDANEFTGVFDGNDYVIHNADVNMPGWNYVGLFGYLETDGQIRNLGVEDTAVIGDDYVGGLVGYSYFGIISNCYSTGSVNGDQSVGGLVGVNGGAISNCYSTVYVSGYGEVGALVGINYGTINNCYSSGSINGHGFVGGLVGVNYAGDISNSYSTGSVTGEEDVGGLVGVNYLRATITNCYSTGDVSGYSSVGGLLGWNYDHTTIANCYSTGSVDGNECVGGLVGVDQSQGKITNCYSTGSVDGNECVGGLVALNFNARIERCYSAGNVKGNDYVGGLVGDNYCSISNCFSTGSVTGTHSYVGGLVGENHAGIGNCYSTGSVSGGYDVGGLLGSNYSGTIGSSFWDIETSQRNTSAGGTPKTTAKMKTQSTFTSAGWDFIEVWDIGENQTYPFLRTYLAGDINHDGVVDFRDITHLAADWLGGVE